MAQFVGGVSNIVSIPQEEEVFDQHQGGGEGVVYLYPNCRGTQNACGEVRARNLLNAVVSSSA
jgi:hypothetical protein